MTVIEPNSISGITSITAQANEINVFRSDGTLAGLQLNGVNFNNTSGISTLAALNVTGNVSVGGTLTYEDVTNIDSVGIVTARSGIHIDDSIVHIGDTNTKIRFPAADTFAVETAGSERLHITSIGKVGIDNGSPDNKLSVYDVGYCGLELKSNRSTATDNIGGVHWKTQSTDVAYLQSLVNGTIRFRNTSSLTERLRITNTGRLGINNTSPQYLMHAKHNGEGGNERIDLHMTNDTTGHSNTDGVQFGYQNSNGAYIWNFENTGIYFGTNNNTKMTITSGGDVLLNDTTNSIYNDTSGGGFNFKSHGQLVLKKEASSVGDPLVWLNDTGQTTNKTIVLAQDGAEKGFLGLTGTSLSLGAGGSEKVRIDSNGNLNVLDGSVIATNTGAGSGTSNLELQPYGTQGYINFTGNSHLYLRMGSSYAQRFIFRNNGDLELSDGNLMVASGHGIDFSATAHTSGKTSELLDDYEEGSFTPVLAMSSGGHNVGYAIQLGKYTKIGNMVHVEVYIELNAISSNGSGYLRLNNLPFTSITGSSNTYGGLHCPWYNSMNNTPMRGGLIDRGNNWAFLYNQFESGTGTIQNASIASAFGVGSKFILVGSYTAQ